MQAHSAHSAPSVQTASAIAKMEITSLVFNGGGDIPRPYTGDGADRSPPLQWSKTPSGTRQLALLCEDPDAPTKEPFVHWLIYDIPGDTMRLPEDLPRREELKVPYGARQGINGFGNSGYNGPKPPHGHGVHHYHFKLYALDSELNLPAGLSKNDLMQAIKGHVIGQGEIVGTYQR